MECVHAILIGMRGADLRIIALTGIQVMIELLNASFVECLRRSLGDQTKAATDANINLFFYTAYSFGEKRDLAIVSASCTDHDAVAATMSLFGCSGSFKQLIYINHRVTLDIGSRDTRL